MACARQASADWRWFPPADPTTPLTRARCTDMDEQGQRGEAPTHAQPRYRNEAEADATAGYGDGRNHAIASASRGRRLRLRRRWLCKGREAGALSGAPALVSSEQIAVVWVWVTASGRVLAGRLKQLMPEASRRAPRSVPVDLLWPREGSAAVGAMRPGAGGVPMLSRQIRSKGGPGPWVAGRRPRK